MRSVLECGAGVLILRLLDVRKDDDLLEEEHLQLPLLLARIHHTVHGSLHKQAALGCDLAIKVLETAQHHHHVVDRLDHHLHLLVGLLQHGHLLVQAGSLGGLDDLLDQQLVFGDALHRLDDQVAQL